MSTSSVITLEKNKDKKMIASTKIWCGVFWKLVSCACFACNNILVRYLSGGSPISIDQSLPTHTIMLWQNLLGALLLLVLLRGKNLTANKISSLQFLRLLFAIIGVYFWFLGLRYLPLPHVIALSFIAPILTVIGALIFLREKLLPRKTFAIFLSLIGGFFISRPDLVLKGEISIHWHLLLPIVAALLFAIDRVITRKIIDSDVLPETITFQLLFFMGLAGLVASLKLGWVTPNNSNFFWLIVLALFGLGAHYSFSKAYAFAEVTVLLPFGIAKMLICSIGSFLIFQEIPNTSHAWIGIVVLTGSTLLLETSLVTRIMRK